jgi:leucyl-tRNA synthetase
MSIVEKKPFDFSEFEKKWTKKWAEAKIYQTPEIEDNSDKLYILDMFPYPSGDGLHVGHVEGYTASDIYSRYWRMRGKKVMHPMGWDAFGLPAENFAVKTKIHPTITTERAIKTFTSQINSLGLSYDWAKEIQTSQPEYYKWTQWFFLLLFQHGLAYKKQAKVNWCDSCQTVLANEQAEGGRCERCGSEVVQKDLEQWFFKITDFIEDQEYEGRTIKGLLSGLETIDWPESTKQAQRNWIGRSEGASIKFPISPPEADPPTADKFQFPNKSQAQNLNEGVETPANSKFSTRGGSASGGQIPNSYYLEVFTTRPDTLFGCTYMVVAPEHPLIADFKQEIVNLAEVENYIQATRKKTDLERTDLNKEKTGVEIQGIKAINPVNQKEIPIFVADYVLSTYGSGAIMAVPAHDERDYEFAQKFHLPIIKVVEPPKLQSAAQSIKDLGISDGVQVEFGVVADCWEDDGTNINSDFLNGLPTAQAKKTMLEWLEQNKLGGKKVQYRLRDWLVSRQRYWGAPIPIVYCEFCGASAVSENELPVELPDDVDFKPTGVSPLINSKKFHDVKCPKCGSIARRESDTMDTFVCSSWYFFRFADSQNDQAFASQEQLEKWLPVDVYIGGAEHSVLHLLYARFFTKVLQKYGYIEFNEPFLRLKHPGTIVAEDGHKMSKSKGNVVNPDDMSKKFGADSVRLYEMFMGAFEDSKPWNTKGMVGVSRFLDKVVSLFSKADRNLEPSDSPSLFRLAHKTIKKVQDDLENFKFNTAIAQLMILTNSMSDVDKLPYGLYELLIIILAPLAPFTSEEIWERLGNDFSVHQAAWPAYDPAQIQDSEVSIAIQVNGKLRGVVQVLLDADENLVRQIAANDDRVKKYLTPEIKKIIFVQNKVINFIL